MDPGRASNYPAPIFIRRQRPALSALLVTSLLAATLTGLSGRTAVAATGLAHPRSAASGCTVAFGAYESSAPWNFGPLNTLEGQINRHMAIVHWYRWWGGGAQYSDLQPDRLAATLERGSIPMVTWEPHGGGGANPFPLTQIAAGAYDGYVDAWADGVRAYGGPVLIRFAHEMNDPGYEWGMGRNGNQPADYVAAFRHVHDRFVQRSATNARWVWAVDGDVAAYPIDGLYPGDDYVDWVGTDVYNWGPTQPWSSWKPLAQALAPSYAALAAQAPYRPMMLSEFASVEQGGDKAAWITEAAAAIPASFPLIRAAVWFNEAGSSLRLALDSSPAALAAARAAFGTDPYCGAVEGPPGPLGSGPDAASWAANRLDVVALGSDQQPWRRFWSGSGWTGWQPLGGQLTADPSVVSRASGRLDILGRGTDGELWLRSLNGGSWSAWTPLGGVLVGGPAAAAWGSKRLDIFATGTDGELWHRWWDGFGWYGWEPLGGSLTSDPAVAAWGPNRLDVFARGTDNQMWHRWWNGFGWNGWEPLGGTLTSDPTVGAWGSNRLDVFAQGNDGGLWHRWWDGAAWNGWESQGGSLNSGPGVAAWGPNRLDVFARGTDNKLWHRWWDGAYWNGWETQQGPPASP